LKNRIYYTVFSFIFILLTSSDVIGQSQSYWTEDEKKTFKEECLKNLISQNLKDEANITCSCVLEKFLKKYPRAKDAEANGQRKMLQITLSCLPKSVDGGWHPLIQRQFFETCMELSNPNKSIKSPKDFCFCLIGKFQGKYKQEELLNLTELDRNKQIEATSTECNP